MSEQDFGEEGGIPAGRAAFHDETVLLARVLFQQAQREAAEPREVLGDEAITNATLVFAERHVEAPVARVLDPQMTADGFRERLYAAIQTHTAFQTGDGVLHVTGFAAVSLTRAVRIATSPAPAVATVLR